MNINVTGGETKIAPQAFLMTKILLSIQFEQKFYQNRKNGDEKIIISARWCLMELFICSLKLRKKYTVKT